MITINAYNRGCNESYFFQLTQHGQTNRCTKKINLQVQMDLSLSDLPPPLQLKPLVIYYFIYYFMIVLREFLLDGKLGVMRVVTSR